MRELTMTEVAMVAGGDDSCGAKGGGGNVYAGVGDTKSFGDDLVDIYEGLVQAASHIIERVAESF